jgi:L-aspartate oxidase
MSEYRYDFLVVGSGLAGLLFALEAARLGRVAVLAKRAPGETNTRLAQGGIASVAASGDTFASHAADTVAAGGGICHPQVVTATVEEGPEAIRRLEGCGVRFAPGTGGERYDLGREGGHSRRRVLHASDATGRVIQESLLERAKEDPQIDLLADRCAVDLITSSKLDGSPARRNETRVLGAYVLDARSGVIETFLAAAVVLATGGCGKVYRYTSNPDVACGDGLAMAYRAGARLANLEFVQFHPTCLFDPRRPRFLISEATRGEGAVLRSISGDRFMDGRHPLGSLAPRDVVARSCDLEMKRRGDRHVLLDMSGIGRERIKRRFPMIYATCLELGLDIAQSPIPVVPAAHYMCGGVVTDMLGRTDLVDLYAIGEVACTGLHGANRLASNSLLESAVFALRAAQAARDEQAARGARAVSAGQVAPWDPGGATVAKESVLVNAHWEMVRGLMWDFVGIVRSDHRLALAAKYMSLFREIVERYYWDFVLDSDLVELRNISLVAELIIAAAAARRESRGLHFNADHQEKDEGNWKCDTIVDPLGEPVRAAQAGELPLGRRESAWRRSAGGG